MKIVIWEADIIGILILVQTDLLYNNSSWILLIYDVILWNHSDNLLRIRININD